MMLALLPPFAPQNAAPEPSVAPRRLAAASSPDALVARVVAGERGALVELYREQQHRVRAFARRVLGSDSSADDLVHELFLDAPTVLRNFRGESTVGSFLVGVAAHRAKHHVRAAMRRRHAEDRASQEPPPSTPTPERELQRRELAAGLERALAGLPLDQRIAFVMCEVEERSSVEVAALLGERDGTIRGRLHLAKKKLREALGAPPESA